MNKIPLNPPLRKGVDFYDNQKILIDLAIEVLRKEMPKYKEKYENLFYGKNIPPHIIQPLQALKNKINFKPIYEKIENELEIGRRKAKTLVEYFGFSFVLRNLEKIKPFKKQRFNKEKLLEIENSIKGVKQQKIMKKSKVVKKLTNQDLINKKISKHSEQLFLQIF